jgi:hypothetical protein
MNVHTRWREAAEDQTFIGWARKLFDARCFRRQVRCGSPRALVPAWQLRSERPEQSDFVPAAMIAA